MTEKKKAMGNLIPEIVRGEGEGGGGDKEDLSHSSFTL